MENDKKPLFIVIVLSLIIFILAGFSLFLVRQRSTTPILTKNSKTEVNALTFYHWWTSAGESAALNKLIGVFTKKYPDVAIMATPVTGGAGFKMLPVVETLVNAGEAPDAFQMHAGYEAKPYYDLGLLSNIDYIWQSENLEKVIPPVIQDMNKFDGHYYSVPVGVHRANLIWYNRSILTKAGIDPSKLTTPATFFAACDKLKKNGMANPIQMGESWTVAQVWESILAGTSPKAYQEFINGQLVNPKDPSLVQSFQTLKKYLSYANKDNATLTWDEAVKRVIAGQGAFSLMGDWANGEFKLVGMKYGSDYGAIPFPGTQGMYGLVIDTFQHPQQIAHTTNSTRWLKIVASREGQDAFNPTKGSIPARTDADISQYSGYQKSALTDFQSATLLYPSVVHGSGAPTDLKVELNDIIDHFIKDQNVDKATEEIVAAVSKIKGQFTHQWSLK